MIYARYKQWILPMVVVACVTVPACAEAAVALPTATAVRAEGPVKIDGKLDEPFWSKAVVQSDFQPLGRHSGALDSADATEFRMAFDGQAILVGITCHQKDMNQLVAKVTDRDGPVWSDDSIEVFLRHGGQYYYHFSVNSVGTQFDIRAPVKGELSRAEAAATVLWDGHWEAAAQRGSDQWTVEMRIPLATLDIGPTPPSDWRLNVARHFARANSNFSWAPVKAGFNDPELQGYLKGITIEKGEFPLDSTSLSMAGLLVGENHLQMKLPAAQPGPYDIAASLEGVKSNDKAQKVEKKDVLAQDGILSADLPVIVKEAGVSQKLSLTISESKTQRPVVYRSFVFRVPEPLTASLNWAVYYDSDHSADLTVKLAVAANLANGKIVTRIYPNGSSTAVATHDFPIQSADELHLGLPLADLPQGTYRLEVVAELPQLGQWKKELSFNRIPGPFEK